MTASDPAKKLNTLLKRLRAALPECIAPVCPPWDGVDTVLAELVHSMLLWNTTATQALHSLEKLRSAFVDCNEMRIALAEEIAEALGDADPSSQERAVRLKAALMDVYKREHRMSLAPLAEAGKREGRTYIDSLEGLPSFVANRLILICLGGHAIPVDDRLRDRLAAEKVIDAQSTADLAGDFLGRHVESPLALQTHACLQAWSDSEAAQPKRQPKKSDTAKSPSEKPARTRATRKAKST